MTSPVKIVSFGRLVADQVRIDPNEACALVEQLWTRLAGTHSRVAPMMALPTLDAVGITPFGEVEVREPAAALRHAVRSPHELARELGHLLLRLLASGRSTLATAGPACVDVARRATNLYLPVGAPPPLQSPAALLAELDRFSPPDPSSAIATVYARWMRTTDGGRVRPNAQDA